MAGSEIRFLLDEAGYLGRQGLGGRDLSDIVCVVDLVVEVIGAAPRASMAKARQISPGQRRSTSQSITPATTIPSESSRGIANERSSTMPAVNASVGGSKGRACQILSESADGGEITTAPHAGTQQ